MAVKGSCPCRQTACSVCLLAASRTSMQDAEAWALRRCKDRQNFDCAREKEVFFRQTACGMGKCLYFRVVKSRQSLSNQTAGYCFFCCSVCGNKSMRNKAKNVLSLAGQSLGLAGGNPIKHFFCASNRKNRYFCSRFDKMN